MPNKNSSLLDREADFSGYFKQEEKPTKKIVKEPTLQELPVKSRVTKRLKYFILILAVLALAQFILFYITNKTKYPGLPDGYELITQPGQPPMVAPIGTK